MIHPHARAWAMVLGIAGALVADRLVVMTGGWLAVLLPLIIACRVWKQHCRFLALVLLPIGLALVLIWGVLVAAPPGTPIGKDPAGGLAFAATITLRLALLAGILQVGLLSIPAVDLPYVFSRWGLRGDSLVTALGAFVLLPELQLRSGQVLTARLARGMAPDRSVLSRLKQFPFLLRPLLAWALRSAIQRSESWHQKQLLSQFDEIAGVHDTGPQHGGLGYVVLGVCWLAVNLATRFAG